MSESSFEEFLKHPKFERFLNDPQDFDVKFKTQLYLMPKGTVLALDGKHSTWEECERVFKDLRKKESLALDKHDLNPFTELLVEHHEAMMVVYQSMLTTY